MPVCLLAPVVFRHVADKPTAHVPEIESVEVSADQAVVKQRNSDMYAMSLMFGPVSNRWDVSSAYFDHLFDVTLQGRWFSHGANWVIKPRHTIYALYSLNGPPGPMQGKVVFHPGTPTSEADGYYVIGEFKPETIGEFKAGPALPIAVKLEKDKPSAAATASASTPLTAPSARVSDAQPTPQGGPASNPPIPISHAGGNFPVWLPLVMLWIGVTPVVAAFLFISVRAWRKANKPQSGPQVPFSVQVPYPPDIGSSSPRVLNVGNCHLSTFERLATFGDQFFFGRNKGQLILDEHQLTFSGAGMHTVIPLAAISDLSVGRLPRVMNPMGLHFISVTYNDGGQSKRIILSPYEGIFGLPSQFNQLAAHWFDAIRAAVTAATGRAPVSTPAERLGTPSSSTGLVMLFSSLALVGLVIIAINILGFHNIGPLPHKMPPAVPAIRATPNQPAPLPGTNTSSATTKLPSSSKKAAPPRATQPPMAQFGVHRDWPQDSYDYRTSSAYQNLSAENRVRLDQVDHDFMALWIALERYADAHDDNPPDSLDQLVPVYFKELPSDPFATAKLAQVKDWNNSSPSKGGWGYRYKGGAPEPGNRAWVLLSVGLPDFPYLAPKGNYGLYVGKGIWTGGGNYVVSKDNQQLIVTGAKAAGSSAPPNLPTPLPGTNPSSATTNLPPPAKH